MTRQGLARVAGTVWCVGGGVLLWRSVGLFENARNHDHRSTAALAAAIAIGLGAGAAKGLFVLRRTAGRNLARIERLPEPVRPWQAFPPAFYPLIAFMIGLGVAVRLGASRGWLGGYVTALGVYVGIGVALLASSLPYWRARSS